MKELIEKRNKIIAELREMSDKAKAEKRSLKGDDEASKAYQAKEEELRAVNAEIEAEERNNQLNGFSTQIPQPKADDEARNDESTSEEAEKRDFAAYLKDGKLEGRTNMTVGDQGAIAPKAFVKQIIKDIEEEAPLYAMVNRVSLKEAAGIDVPKLTTDASDASWSAEVPGDAIGADTSMAFGTVTITPESLVKLVLVSKKLVKCSAMDIDTLVRERLAAKNAKAIENAIINGTGTSQQPLGVFTASSSGVSSAQDVTSHVPTNLATTPFTADDLIDMDMKLSAAHRANAVWVMHPEVLKIARKLKDSDGQYLWQPGLRDGTPGTLLGHRVIESTLAPHTFSKDSYIAVLGDFNYYWWVQVEDVEVQVLMEKYADKLQIGYLSDILAGGKPVLKEAFARLKIGTSATAA